MGESCGWVYYDCLVSFQIGVLPRATEEITETDYVVRVKSG
jgi:hypothetical protein